MPSIRRIVIGVPCFALLGVLVSSSPAATPGPHFEFRGERQDLHVPEEMQKTLDERVPGFRPWTIESYPDDTSRWYEHTLRQAPWAVVGEFDGNGYADLVIDGRADSLCVLVCVWGRSQKPDVSILRSDICPDRGTPHLPLEYSAPGYSLPEDRSSVFIRNDGFMEIDEKGSEVWYWDGHAFQHFFTGC